MITLFFSQQKDLVTTHIITSFFPQQMINYLWCIWKVLNKLHRTIMLYTN